MRKLKAIFLIAMITISIPVLAGNSDKTENRNLSGFNAIDVSTGIDLYISMGSSEAVKVVADDDVIDDLKTEVRNGTLHIYTKRNNWLNWGDNKTRKVYVTVTKLEGIDASSGSDVESENTLDGEKLDISASSGSDIELDVHYKNLSLDTSSGSDAELRGKVKYLKLSASSGSDIDAAELESQYCKVSASSGSDISLTVTDELEANASSGADIVYHGNPQMRDIDESSGGDVRGR
ncbi:head GIN domain-containing protein [Maribellus mangrovi]|uniref:head GIN domain-containing protein n=1 Tax=Maribellus mangrovi TaxID=3133146 RepID=UPI0030ED02D4